MTKRVEPSEFKSTVINLLAACGMIIYLVLQCARPLLHLPALDETIVSLTFALTMTIQILRGLLFHIKARLPKWILLSSMDRRLAADSTVVYVILLALQELFLRSLIAGHGNAVRIVSSECIAMQLFLGGTLIVLSLRKSNTNIGIALAATLVFMLIFTSPLLLVAGILYSLYYFMHLTGSRDIESLCVSAFIPLLVAVFILAFNDKRNRSKNTKNVIITQFCVIPFVPLCFFAMRAFWPENYSPMLLPIIVLVPMVLGIIPKRLFGKIEPWLIKEKLEIIEQEMSVDKDLTSEANQGRLLQLGEIATQLSPPKVILKKASDHLDRADALVLLGQLQERFDKDGAAEVSYNEALSAYNQVLLLEPDHGEIVGRKFKTSEKLSNLRRKSIVAG